MMKTTKIILITGLLMCAAQWVQAQVKIGERPLDIGTDRLLEMQAKLGELLIVTDSLEIGITTLDNANTTNPGDAMMLKLFGYGLGQFATEEQTYFLGTNTAGEVLEFPLRLDLDVIQTGSDTSALLSLYSIDTFGTIDLMPLDTIFATDQNLIDSVTRIEGTLTTLIAQNKSNDLDTIQINELIDEIALVTNHDTATYSAGGRNDGQQTVLLFYEDRFATFDGRPEDRAVSSFDLGTYFATLIDLDSVVHDTANSLRGNMFYLIDGTLSSDRTVTGGGLDLTFTGIDSFDISANNNTFTTTGNTSISSNGTTTISSDGDISTTSNTGNVSVTSTAGDVNITSTATGNVNITSGVDIIIDAAGDTIEAVGVVSLNEYPAKPLETDTSLIKNLLGIDNNGNIINVSSSTVLGTQADSVIYRHDGTLSTDRFMTMGGFDLNFVGATAADSVVITSDGRILIGRSEVTPGSTTNGIRLDVNGDILAMQVHSSSDVRFKKDITQLSDAVSKVQAMNGVTYNFRNDEYKNHNFPTTRQLGFIAQEVEKVIPEVVKTDGKGYKSVDYAKITALLNEAIKEQQGQINLQEDLIRSQQEMLSSILLKYDSLSEEMASLKSTIKEISNQTMSEE